jgi:hypothetical protein
VPSAVLKFYETNEINLSETPQNYHSHRSKWFRLALSSAQVRAIEEAIDKQTQNMMMTGTN